MSKTLKMTWNGPAVKSGAEQAGLRGLALAGEHLKRVSVAETPIQEGTLRRSARVQVLGDSVAVSFDTPYAKIQHEALHFRHPEGKAKFLEDPMNREAEKMFAIVAAQIRRALR